MRLLPWPILLSHTVHLTATHWDLSLHFVPHYEEIDWTCVSWRESQFLAPKHFSPNKLSLLSTMCTVSSIWVYLISHPSRSQPILYFSGRCLLYYDGDCLQSLSHPPEWARGRVRGQSHQSVSTRQWRGAHIRETYSEHDNVHWVSVNMSVTAESHQRHTQKIVM